MLKIPQKKVDMKSGAMDRLTVNKDEELKGTVHQWVSRWRESRYLQNIVIHTRLI